MVGGASLSAGCTLDQRRIPFLNLVRLNQISIAIKKIIYLVPNGIPFENTSNRNTSCRDTTLSSTTLSSKAFSSTEHWPNRTFV